MFKPLLAACLAGAPLLAAAHPLAGVWQGTLGKNPITVCFNATPENNASYYYQRFLTPIQLTVQADSGQWQEAENTGQWQLDSPDGERLSGQWHAPDRSKTLPLALSRVPHTRAADDCASDAYALALETAKPSVQVEKKDYRGHGYQVRTQNGHPLLRLDGDTPGIQRINQQLLALAYNAESLAQFNAERRESLGQRGAVYTSEISVLPHSWSSQWITVNFYRWQTGTGAGGISWGLHTWNLATGEKVDPWTWVGGRFDWYSPYAGHSTMPQKFAQWIEAQTPPDADCPGAASYGTYDLSFDTQGLKLANHPSGDGCDVEVAIPWAQLAPLLSAQGRAVLPSLQQP